MSRSTLMIAGTGGWADKAQPRRRFVYTRAKANEDAAATEHQPHGLPVVLTIEETYRLLRISRWLLYDRYIHTGKLRTIKVGHRRVVPLAAIERLIEQEAGGPGRDGSTVNYLERR